MMTLMEHRCSLPQSQYESQQHHHKFRLPLFAGFYHLSSFFHFLTSLRLNYLILVIPVFDFGSIIRIMVDLIFQYWGIAASARIEENFF